MSDAKPYHSMTPAEYLAALQRLGFARPGGKAYTTQGIQPAGRFFGKAPRTAQDWARHGPSSEAAMMLRLMDALKLDAAGVEALLGKAARRKRN